MRFCRRTLLILVVVVPPMLAAGWLQTARYALRQRVFVPIRWICIGLVLCDLIILAIGVIVAELFWRLFCFLCLPAW